MRQWHRIAKYLAALGHAQDVDGAKQALGDLLGGLTWWQPWAPEFEPASVSRMAYPLPEKPSIAVMPFDDFSGKKKDAFIARSLTEDIITALSKVPQLLIISRTSSFAFKEKYVTATEIAEELGVR